MHGRCLVISCTRNNQNFISVVLGADTKKDRTKDSIKIIEYSFSNYSKINLKEKVEEEFEKWKQDNNIRVIKGKADNILPTLGNFTYENYPIKKFEDKQIKIDIVCKEELNVPVEENTVVGNIKVKNKEEEILNINLIINKHVDKKDEIDYWNELWRVYKMIPM